MLGKMFGVMFFVLAACSAAHAVEDSDASCSSVDETSHLQLNHAGQNPDLPGMKCVINGTVAAVEQSGINVTEGFEGTRDTEGREPITTTFSEAGMCVVNVHWHQGAEHYSVGEYDLEGPVAAPMKSGKSALIGAVQSTKTGPTYTPIDVPDDDARFAGLQAAAAPRQGFRCHHYKDNLNDPAFNTEYKWKHCVDMHVGETYEFHWPSSAAGACGTKWQYQTPFPDGLFCKDGILTDQIWTQIGVMGQVFTIVNPVNDDQYYFPDLFDGPVMQGDYWNDVAYYTGSSTGTTYNNTYCSTYAPITWQVDRKCHLVSASSVDKMCKKMKHQADNMKADLVPHGSRERVLTEYAADNVQLLEESVQESTA